VTVGVRVSVSVSLQSSRVVPACCGVSGIGIDTVERKGMSAGVDVVGVEVLVWVCACRCVCKRESVCMPSFRNGPV